MRIALLEPYDTGSHAAWLRGYQVASSHEVVPLTCTGQFWKWRMHGGAVTLAHRLARMTPAPGCLLASDMLDLTTLLALMRRSVGQVPAALYVHENQLTYPVQPGAKRDLHYGFINYASMLCADAIYFNSAYHLEAWFEELPRMLKHFPDYNELSTIGQIYDKSQVLPLGLDLTALDAPRSTIIDALAPDRPPLLLWNHRWEYDKAPDVFLNALYTLQERGHDFQVAFLGESFVRVPPEFDEARERLADRIVQFGWVPQRSSYASWLWQADICVSTAIHEFFGAAVVEALYCDCFPILPNRLAYPQFIPDSLRSVCLYEGADALVERLEWAITHIAEVRATSLRSRAAVYDWGQMGPRYDAALETMVRSVPKV